MIIFGNTISLSNEKAPKYKTGGGILGDPKNPAKTTIDFSKYKTQLSKPIEGTGTNVVSDNPSGLTPEALKGMGYNYISGSIGNKDAVYEKNGNYHCIQSNQTHHKIK